jgi:uroporphyrinogen-III decarboxylase
MILNHFTGLIKNLAAEMCDTGIDAIKISSPFAGAGFISPDNYREFVLPYEREIVNAIREKDVHVYIHTCGLIGDRLELMFETGMSGIECLDPPPIGNVKLEDAVNIISGKGFIKGNIDSVNTLLAENQDVILEDVKNRLEIGTKNPGFILSTACSIAPTVKKENIRLLREVVDTF